jgi:hypothetical protein
VTSNQRLAKEEQLLDRADSSLEGQIDLHEEDKSNYD